MLLCQRIPRTLVILNVECPHDRTQVESFQTVLRRTWESPERWSVHNMEMASSRCAKNTNYSLLSVHSAPRRVCHMENKKYVPSLSFPWKSMPVGSGCQANYIPCLHRYTFNLYSYDIFFLVVILPRTAVNTWVYCVSDFKLVKHYR